MLQESDRPACMPAVAELFSRSALVDEMDTRVAMGLREWEQAVVARYFPAAGRILNIGCGAGREAIALAKRGYELVAVDIAAAQIERARANAAAAGVTIRFLQTNGLTVPAGPFDAIVLWAQVLGNMERCQDQFTLLTNCRRALGPQGIISASGHNKVFCQQDSPDHTDQDWLYPWGKGELRYHLFTPDSFAAMFRETGWRILVTEIPPSLPAILYTVAHTP